jgi:DNA-binding NtrC family response regulator
MLLEGRMIGLVEDDPVMGGSLVQSLSLEGCHVEWWKTAADAIRELRTTTPDLVICDIRLPDMEGSTLFRQLAATTSLPPVLFITAYGDIDQAVALMREGAADYVMKPFEIGGFIEKVRTLVQRNATPRPGSILGPSPQMQVVESTLRRICDLTSPVLISGETGTGKEICARFLHENSSRSKEPFVAVNCAAIPSDSMDSQLFGYRGSSSQSFHRGFAERARGGILFLDEVSELPLTLQAKLLRLVETREYNRLGGEQPVVFHGRIVCSTNRDLVDLVRSGQFREDFYFRIAGMCVELPSLRQRPSDIPWLVEHFFEQSRGQDYPHLRGVSPLTIDFALTYPWPGNVREVRNRMERAVALAKSEWILPGDLFPDLEAVHHPMVTTFATLSEARDLAERRQIERALQLTNGQILEATRLLGVSRTTLWEKMKRLGISGEQAQE